jgi:hypothetical protein
LTIEHINIIPISGKESTVSSQILGSFPKNIVPLLGKFIEIIVLLLREIEKGYNIPHGH